MPIFPGQWFKHWPATISAASTPVKLAALAVLVLGLVELLQFRNQGWIALVAGFAMLVLGVGFMVWMATRREHLLKHQLDDASPNSATASSTHTDKSLVVRKLISGAPPGRSGRWTNPALLATAAPMFYRRCFYRSIERDLIAGLWVIKQTQFTWNEVRQRLTGKAGASAGQVSELLSSLEDLHLDLLQLSKIDVQTAYAEYLPDQRRFWEFVRARLPTGTRMLLMESDPESRQRAKLVQKLRSALTTTGMRLPIEEPAAFEFA